MMPLILVNVHDALSMLRSS